MSEEITKKKQEEQNLDKLTIKELREIAAQFPHERAILDMKKPELVAFIKQAKGISDDSHTRQRKIKAKLTMTKADIKAKIRELKILKAQAQESNQKKLAGTLRHKIGHLKKVSRRVAGI